MKTSTISDEFWGFRVVPNLRNTPVKFNSSPRWLEDDPFLLGPGSFSGANGKLRGGIPISTNFNRPLTGCCPSNKGFTDPQGRDPQIHWQLPAFTATALPFFKRAL